jgi:hypothetical protein
MERTGGRGRYLSGCLARSILFASMLFVASFPFWLAMGALATQELGVLVAGAALAALVTVGLLLLGLLDVVWFFGGPHKLQHPRNRWLLWPFGRLVDWLFDGRDLRGEVLLTGR